MSRIVKPGEKIKANDINNLPKNILDKIKAGKNITIRRNNDRIVINSEGGGGGPVSSGGLEIEEVLELPPLDEANQSYLDGWFVFWLSEESSEGGTGDDQIWTTRYPQRRWFPTQKFTTKSGIPIVIEGS
jgi:hypothetical protein